MMEELEFDDYTPQPKETLRLVFNNLWNVIYSFVEKYKIQSAKLQELTNENQLLKSEIDTLRNKLNDFEDKFNQVIVTEKSQDIELLETENKELRSKLFKLEESIKNEKDWAEELDQLRLENERLRNDLIEKEKERKVTQVDFANFETIAEQNARLISQNQKLSLENEQSKGIIEDLRKQLSSLRQSNIELEKMAKLSQTISEKFVQLEKNLEKVVIEKIEKEREIEQLRDKIHKIESTPQLPGITQDGSYETFCRIIASNSKLSKFFEEDAFSNPNVFAQKFVNFFEDYENFEKKLADFQSQIVELENTLKSFETSKEKEVYELQQEIVFHKNRISGLERELVNKEKNIFELQQEVEHFNAKKEEFSKIVTELNQKTLELEEKQLQIEELQEKVKQLHEQIEHKDQQIAQINKQIEFVAGEISYYRTSIDELTNQIELLNVENNELRSEKNELEKTNQNLQNNNTTLNEKLTELKQYKNEFYHVQNELNLLKQVNIELKEMNRKTNEEKLELERKIFRLTKERNENLDKIEELAREKERLGIILDERNKTLKNTTSELAKIKLKLEERDASKKVLASKVEQLVSEIDAFISELE